MNEMSENSIFEKLEKIMIVRIEEIIITTQQQYSLNKSWFSYVSNLIGSEPTASL